MEEVPSTAEIEEPPAPPYVRSWSDVVQLGVTAATVALAVGLTRVSGGGIRAVEREVLRGVEGLTAVVAGFLVGAIQTIAAYLPLVIVAVMVVMRHFPRLPPAVPAVP